MGTTLEEDPYADLAGGYGQGSDAYDEYDQVAQAPAPGPARGAINPVTSPGAGAPAPAARPTSYLSPRGQAIVEGIRTRRAERQHPTEPEPVGDFYDAAPQIEAPVVEHGWAHDMTRRVWASTQEMAGSLISATQMAQQAIGDSPEATAWLERQNQALKENIKSTLASMNPNRQAAVHTKIFGDQDIDPATGKKYPTPGEVGYLTVAADRIASFIPQLPLLFTGPAGWGGRVIAGLLFGTMGAGDAYAGAADSIHAMTPEQLAANPVSAEVLKQGGSPDQARETLLKGAAMSWQSLGAAGLGAVAGVGLRGAVKPGAADVGRKLLPRVAISGGEAGGVLGFQTGGMEALQQSTDIGLGTRQDYDPEKIALASASGFTGGAVLGGAAGGLLGKRPTRPGTRPEVEPPVIEGVSGEQQAGMETALGPVILPPRAPQVQGELDLSQAPAGQGELFRPIEQANPPLPGATPAMGPPTLADTQAQSRRAGQYTLEGQRGGPGQITGPTGPGDIPPRPEPIPGPPLMAMPEQAPAAAAQGAPGGVGQTIAPPPNVTQAVSPGSIAARQPARAPGQAINRQSQNMTATQLREALSTMPGQDPRQLKIMPKPDLARRYDELTRNEQPQGEQIPPAAAQAEQPPPVGEAPVVRPAPISGEVPREALPVEGTTARPAEIREPGAKVTAEKAPPETTTVVEPISKVEPKAEPVVSEAVSTPSAISAIPARAKTPQEILKEKVLAKRAEQKARQAEVAEKPLIAKGAYVEAEAPTPEAEARLPATREQVEDRRTGAIQRVTAALNVAGRQIQTLKKGQDVQPIVSRVMRDLAERIGRTDGSDGAVAEQITGWARANKGKIPGATTSFYDVGDRVLKLLTGHGIPERETFMKGAAREAEAQPVRFETEKPGEETTTVVAHGPAAEAGEAKPKAPTTDHEKIANRLLDEVLEGAKTPAEAHAEFGEQGEGAGRKRREGLENFPTFLRREIARAEDPALRQAIIDALERTQKETGGSTTEKGNVTKATNKLLERTSPEHIAKLREMVREIEDPVGHAADREEMRPVTTRTEEEHARDVYDQHNPEYAATRERLAEAHLVKLRDMYETSMPEKWLRDTARKYAEDDMRAQAVENMLKAGGREPREPLAHQSTRTRTWRRAILDGLEPLRSRYARLIDDPRIHTEVTAALARPGATTHSVLQAILDHALLRTEMRPLVELARALLKKAPNLEIMSAEHAFGLGRISAKSYANVSRPSVHGFYSIGLKGDPFISIKPHAARPLETFLHEAMHSVTEDYIAMLQHLDPQHPDLKAIGVIQTELLRQLQTHYHEPALSDSLVQDLKYALTSVHETHTMLMTNPEMQAFAASVMASSHFRTEMARLGHPMRGAGSSVWRAFTDWTRKALGLSKPASASEYTLLDHLLRPLQDITDRAIAHNEQYLPREPVLRERAEPLMRETTKAFDRGREAIGERIAELGSGRVGDAARRIGMPLMGLDRLVDRYGHFFQTPEVKDPATGKVIEPARNLMENYRTAVERVGARAKALMDEFHDRARDIAARLKGNDTLAGVMNAAGYARAHLGSSDPDANAHLKTPDEKAALAAVEAQYARLPAEDRKTYQDTVKFNNELYAEVRAADLGAMIDAILPDATPAQRKVLQEGLKSKKAFDAFLKDPDNSTIAAAFTGPGGFGKYRDAVKGIAKFHSQGFVQGDYFPMNRFGNYVLVYGEHGQPGYGMEMFESRAAANARRKDLLDAKVADVHQIQDRSDPTRERLPPSNITEELITQAQKSPNLKASVGELRDMLDQIRLRHATQAEFARTRARRKGIAGASNDLSRAEASFMSTSAHQIGYVEHGLGVVRAREEMKNHAEYLARTSDREVVAAGQVVNELKARDAHIQTVVEGGFSALARKATAFGYVQSLLSPSRILTEGIENTLRAGAWIGARHGHVRTSLAITRAIAELAPTMLKGGVRNTMNAVRRELHQADWNLSRVFEQRLLDKGYDGREVRDFFKAGTDAGLFDSTWSRTIQQMAKPGGFTPGWQKFMDVSGAMGHASEEFTRIAPTWAAYQLERAAGRSPAEARAYALNVLRKAPNWNPLMQPRITTEKGMLGKFAAPMTQFKKYGLNEYSVLFTALRDSLHGASPEQQRETRKALAGIIAVHAVMAGTLTWMADPVRYIMGAWDLIHGNAPHDYMPDMQAFMSDMLGPELGEIVSMGVPHLAGIDLSQRLGVRNMLNIPPLESFDKKGFMTAIGTGLMGAAGEDAAVSASGFIKVLQGDMSGIKDVVPRIIRDPIKAYGLAQKGVTDPTGKVIVPPEKITGADVARQALGFQPSQVSEARAGRAAVVQMRNEWKGEHDKLEQRWLEAEPADRPAVMSEIREWNQTHHGMTITMGQLIRQQEARRKQAKAPFGLRLPPRAAKELSQAGRFAAQ